LQLLIGTGVPLHGQVAKISNPPVINSESGLSVECNFVNKEKEDATAHTLGGEITPSKQTS
jgi:hypothetical protein